jgi:hypothetical protein
MKKNVKYVKNVLDKIKNEAKTKREHLFYSIGILCILFVCINRYTSVKEQNVPEIEEKKVVVEEVVNKPKKGMSFKEKFKKSRAYYGKTGLFNWNGKTYHCKYKEEMQ